MAGIVVHLKYARYIVRHKWFVFVEARRLGVPWLGLAHDLSKLFPDEWRPYARYFYADDLGHGGKEQAQAAFNLAWLYHQKRNKHHWQYWVAPQDDGGVHVEPMPDRYRREMLADWRGAGKAIPGASADTRAWYLKTRPNRNLHPDTLAWVEAQLGMPAARVGAGDGE